MAKWQKWGRLPRGFVTRKKLRRIKRAWLRGELVRYIEGLERYFCLKGVQPTGIRNAATLPKSDWQTIPEVFEVKARM
jgi:hypothetical protein